MVKINKIEKNFCKWYRIKKEDLSNELFESVEFNRDLDFLSLSQARKIQKIIEVIRLFLLYKAKKGEELNNFRGSDILEMLEEWRDWTKGKGWGYIWDSFEYFFKNKPKQLKNKGPNAWEIWKHWEEIHSFAISYTSFFSTELEREKNKTEKLKSLYGEDVENLNLKNLLEKYKNRAEKAKKTIRQKRGY